MGNLEIKELFKRFKGRRIFVTGDTGFKGTWLCLWLHELGAEVVGYALPPAYTESHFSLVGLDKQIKHIDGDIRDYDKLKRAVDDFQPEFLFHLAAQAIVKQSYADPKETFDTNVAGSTNILEIVRQSDFLKSVVYVTSDKCYNNKEWLWGYRENDELGGRDPYSASKAAAEMVFHAYLESFFKDHTGLGVASVRAGNVIGGGDWASHRIVPDCIRFLQENRPIVLRKPQATRPWQHVLEPLSGYMTLAAHLFSHQGQYSGAWNFGPPAKSIHTVLELVQQIVGYWGSGVVERDQNDDTPYEAGLLQLNCDKANQLLNWHSHWDFETTVKQTVDWYINKHNKKPVLEYSLKQINAYMEGK